MKLSIELQAKNRQNGEGLRNIGMKSASAGTTQTQKPPSPRREAWNHLRQRAVDYM